MPSNADVTTASPKQQFLTTFDREHVITMRVLRAYPADQLDLRPHPTCRTARELAWVFVAERGLGTAVYQNKLQELMSGEMPQPPESWDALLEAIEDAQRKFRDLIEATPENELHDTVTFYVAPKQLGEMTRFQWLWFLLHDEIHHRGQFSIYLRMAGAKVPSIYGPTADEPWM